jgi:hypothetical protein
LLGWAFAGEEITGRTLLAAAVILAGVAIITGARDARERRGDEPLLGDAGRPAGRRSFDAART